MLRNLYACFFKSSVNKNCDYASVYLSGNHIEFVQEVKYLVALLNSSMKTSIDVSLQTRKFYAQANMLLCNFWYCGREIKCKLFKSFCTNMYCCPLWFNSTSSSIKKLKSSYNSVLRRLLCIRMPHSISEMFVSCSIPSFYELLRKCIFNFSEQISKNTNSIIEACLSPKVYIFSPIRQCMFSIILTINYFIPIILLLFLNTSSLILICHVVFLYLYFYLFFMYDYGQLSAIKDLYYILTNV